MEPCRAWLGHRGGNRLSPEFGFRVETPTLNPKYLGRPRSGAVPVKPRLDTLPLVQPGLFGEWADTSAAGVDL